MDLYPSCATGRHAVGEITLACGPAVKITILSQGEKQRVIRSHYACTQSTYSMGIDAAIRRDQDPDRAEWIRAKSNLDGAAARRDAERSYFKHLMPLFVSQYRNVSMGSMNFFKSNTAMFLANTSYASGHAI